MTFIEKIESSDKIDGVTKLIALCEIDDMVKNDIIGGIYIKCEYVSLAFTWRYSKLGVSFWSKISRLVD